MDLDVAVGEGDLAYADEAAERVGRALAERVGEDRSRDRGVDGRDGGRREQSEAHHSDCTFDVGIDLDLCEGAE